MTALVAFYNERSIPSRKRRQLEPGSNFDNVDIGGRVDFGITESKNWANLEEYLIANIAAQTGSTLGDINVSYLGKYHSLCSHGLN